MSEGRSGHGFGSLIRFIILHLLYCHARLLVSLPRSFSSSKCRPSSLPSSSCPRPPSIAPRASPSIFSPCLLSLQGPQYAFRPLLFHSATDHTASQLPKSACIIPPPTLRRRSKPPSFALRRRRLTSRVEYAPEPLPIHPFDKLPWIASMDRPMDNVRLNDLADLSLLPDDPFISRPTIHPSGTGPIRRRKPSSRRSSLRVTPLEIRTERGDEDLFHYASHLFPRNVPERPSTPMKISRLDPAHITFRHLMPVIDDGL